jgi:dephospho-CoA kinase
MDTTASTVYQLTGGIGSGQSAVAALLQQRGATIIDADRVGHTVIAPDGSAFQSVSARWPGVVIDGEIDRRRLGGIVFSHPDQLAELEALTHPAIAQALLSTVERLSGQIFVEAAMPLAWIPDAWHVVLVTASRSVRRARVIARGLSSEEADDRIARQPSDEVWAAKADSSIDNTGTWEDLQKSVGRWWQGHIGEQPSS